MNDKKNHNQDESVQQGPDYDLDHCQAVSHLPSAVECVHIS